MKSTIRQCVSFAVLFLMCFVGAPANASAQSRQITGVITDDSGASLPGVSIIVKGTPTGTIADSNGKYAITVPDNAAVLQFSFIGYGKVELSVGTRSVLDVTMSESQTDLDELVVVGYGAVRKRDLTGSVSSVRSSTISKQPVTNLMQAIQGHVPGIMITNTSTRPGQTPTVMIRGKRSINGGSNPLYVLDGIPFEGSMNDISPADIESIDILKDASATAIYGARGSNGVIMITTKKGSEGKTQVDYNGRIGIQTVLRQIEFMNGAEYAEFIREGHRASGTYPSDVPVFDLDAQIEIFKDPYTLESLRMAYDENGNYDPSKVRSDSEWWKAVQRTGIVSDHQLSIRGGTSNSSFLISGTFYNDKGLVKGEEFKRYTIRVNLDRQINKFIKVGVQSMYSRSLQERGANIFGSSSFKVMPLGRLYDENGELTWRVSGEEDQMLNPLQKIGKNAASSPYRRSNFLGSYYTEIKLPLDGLRFRSNLGLEVSSIQDYSFMSAIARAAQVNSSKNAQTFRNSYTWENLLYYNKEVKDHSFGVTLLQSIQAYKSESNSISVEDTPDDAALYYNVGGGESITSLSSNKTESQFASFMGRINYTYKGRYLFTGSLRYDGSSRLAEGHQWVLFPSAALAWRISDEPFMRNVPAVSNLKLRLGYGSSASSEVEPYGTKGTLSRRPYNFGAMTLYGYAPGDMPNRSLTWETTGQWNLGLDFGFFNQRLNGTVDAYVQNTTDLLMERMLPAVSGFGSVMSNIGRTRNKGIEVSLSGVNVKTPNFSWTTDVMFYFNKEEIVELYIGKQDDPGNSWFIGEALNVFYNYKKVGIWQDTPEDQAEMALFRANGNAFEPGMIKLWDNGDHKITEDDRVILGKIRPDYIVSLNNTFQYKGFDLGFFFNASFGAMINSGVGYLTQPQRSSGPKLNYWTPNNPSNDFPRPNVKTGTPANSVTLQYEKADYIKLRNITLGYTLPSRITQKLNISRCRFYLQTQNPWMWTTYSLVDPEGINSSVDGDSQPGMTRPTPTIWALGINMSF